MKHIIFTPDRNSKKADGTMDNDFVGAFDPESRRYAKYWRSCGDEVVLLTFDLSKRAKDRVESVLAAIETNAPIDRLAFFCHGWRTGLQPGLSSGDVVGRAGLMKFAQRLAAASTPGLKIALYACSTGSSNGPPGDGGDGGFADLLRDALCASGREHVTIFAHTTAGHTTRNEFIRLFSGHGNPLGGIGGDDVVVRKSAMLTKLDTRLNAASDDFRWRIPYLSADEIRAELT